MESKTAEVTPSTQDKSGRRKRRWTVLASALGVVLLGGATGYFWLSSSAEVNAQGVQECTEVVVESPVGDAETDAITDGVCQTLGSLTQAWAAHDAEAYGAAFTESATYTPHLPGPTTAAVRTLCVVMRRSTRGHWRGLSWLTGSSRCAF